MSKALEATGELQTTTNCVLEIVSGKEMPELSIVDYLIWAVQRNLIHGENRYFEALKSKYETILHLYTDNQ